MFFISPFVSFLLWSIFRSKTLILLNHFFPVISVFVTLGKFQSISRPIVSVMWRFRFCYSMFSICIKRIVLKHAISHETHRYKSCFSWAYDREVSLITMLWSSFSFLTLIFYRFSLTYRKKDYAQFLDHKTSLRFPFIFQSVSRLIRILLETSCPHFSMIWYLFQLTWVRENWTCRIWQKATRWTLSVVSCVFRLDQSYISDYTRFRSTQWWTCQILNWNTYVVTVKVDYILLLFFSFFDSFDIPIALSDSFFCHMNSDFFISIFQILSFNIIQYHSYY